MTTPNTNGEAKFTSGPWKCAPGQLDDHSDYGGGGFSVFPSDLDRTGGGGLESRMCFADDLYPHDGKQYEEAKANAHLIASAPQMFEALEVATNMLVNLGASGPTITVFKNTLALARGEAHADTRGESDAEGGE